jgi:CheY-like chemotaxis protein
VTGRILVVDDEPALVRSISYALEREGFDVLSAADGKEALDVFAAEPCDLIVLDPDASGAFGPRRLPPDPPRERRSDHRADGEGHGARRRARARAGRRRLHDEAVLDGGAPSAGSARTCAGGSSTETGTSPPSATSAASASTSPVAR